jgi:Kef-type K+ transport system membrane component KefB
MVIMFFFLWVGSTIGAAELAALMSGIVLKNTIPDESLENFTSEIRTMCYGFFAPLFFVSVGLSTELSAFGSLAGIILILSIGTALTKIVLTFFSTRKVLGDHGSIVAGIALTVRLSTSIVIIKILLDNNLIPAELYTALIGTTVIFKFINPILISGLIQKWNLSPVSRIK